MYQYILVDFSCKAYCKVDFGHAKILDAIFLGQSLLFNTTVLKLMIECIFFYYTQHELSDVNIHVIIGFVTKSLQNG